MMVLQVKTAKDPLFNIEANNVTVDAISSLTAYAILANTSLAPLFVLNVVGSLKMTPCSNCQLV
jgi:hypothetical protein